MWSGGGKRPKLRQYMPVVWPDTNMAVPGMLRWKARERDPRTGLHYVQARWYHPDVGRVRQMTRQRCDARRAAGYVRGEPAAPAPRRPMRRVLPPALALCLAAGAVLACDDGLADPAAALRGDCAAPSELSAIPAPVAGDWWTEGDRPPTLRITQQGTALAADLAFSGVIRQGGTGTVDGGCVRLTFPPRQNALEPPLVVDGRLLSGGVLRIVLGGTQAESATFTLRRVSAPR
jgi:hypothetical protein